MITKKRTVERRFNVSLLRKVMLDKILYCKNKLSFSITFITKNSISQGRNSYNIFITELVRV